MRGRGHAQKRHEPRHKAVPGPLEHVEKDGEERTANHERKQPALEQVRDEQRQRRLVEPVFFLEHKRLVDRERGADRRRDHEEDRSERKGLGDLSRVRR